MTHSHTFPPLSNPGLDVAELARDAAALFESLVLQRFGPGDAASDFAGFESMVGEIAAASGRDILRSLIESCDVAEPRLMRDGEPRRLAGRSSRTVMTMMGPVERERSRYRRRGRPSWMPADDSLGLLAGWMTWPAAKASLFAVSHCPFQDAEEILRRVGPMAPLASALQDLSAAMHGAWR
ncbi:MAG: hypothetical protein OXI01_05895 [Albidovulum sp.]|nr:hypothetical protein [Albidovulum sp.]